MHDKYRSLQQPEAGALSKSQQLPVSLDKLLKDERNATRVEAERQSAVLLERERALKEKERAMQETVKIQNTRIGELKSKNMQLENKNAAIQSKLDQLQEDYRTTLEKRPGEFFVRLDLFWIAMLCIAAFLGGHFVQR